MATERRLLEPQDGIRAGKLQYQQGAMHGNPFLRLLRRELEALITEKHGAGYLAERQQKTELEHVNLELKRLKTQVAQLEFRRLELNDLLGITGKKGSAKK